MKEMKATGITAEFDPLHNGHAYLMEKARSVTGCDAVVVAMSGDFIQRGEPAVIDKWARTKAALLSGADLVIEIPVLFCLGNASRYASASVRLLEECGCSHIVFGSESGDADVIRNIAGSVSRHKSSIDEGIRALVKEGLSWPDARSRVCKELLGIDIPDTPNDILALEYMMKMDKAEPVAVRRTDSMSASEIRKHLSERNTTKEDTLDGIKGSVPAASADALRRSVMSFTDEWTKTLRYAVMSSDTQDLEDCPSGGEGLANLLTKAAASEDTIEDIIASVKSKRYTYTRISRLCMQTVLGITRTKYPYDEPGYIRVLGFNEKGRQLLSVLKGSEDRRLPIVTNINKEYASLDDMASRMLSLDIHAADIYNLVTGRDTIRHSDHVMKPVII